MRPATHNNKGDESWRIYVQNRAAGMNKTQAYIAAGYSAKSARQSAHKFEKQPHVQKYLDELREKAEVKAVDVLQTLNEQMKFDIDTVLDDNGMFSIEMARELGVTHLIKSITYHRNGSLKGVEAYCAQSAAKALLPVCGLEQLPRQNDQDALREQRKELAQGLVREFAREFMNEGLPADEATEKAIETVIQGTKGEAQPFLADGVVLSDGVH